MRRLLLDTHAFLWFVFDDPRLTPAAAAVIEDPDVEKLLSIVSVWEIAIKEQIGRLSLGMPFPRFLEEHVVGTQLSLVPVELSHLLEYSALPLHHRDPFDRLLVSQALAEGIGVLTSDPSFAMYGVSTSWR
jgi:PIN domain nuclease of toxin-antitoxin system